MTKISHTIRFEKEEKEEIQAIGQLQGRKFQAQVDYMLKRQLKNDRVVMFLDILYCALMALDETARQELMAKIADIVDIEQE